MRIRPQDSAVPRPPSRFLAKRSFYVPLLMDRFTEVSRAEVPKLIEKHPDRLLVQPGDAEVPLPLRSAEDLREITLIDQGQAEKLPQAPIGEQLKSLAEDGWRFHNGDDEVGLYGAYNILTEDEGWPQQLVVKRGSALIDLTESSELARMSRFYQADTTAGELERMGFELYDGNGQAKSAYGLAGASYQVGAKGEKWFSPPADRNRALNDLESFQRLRGAAPSLERAQLAWDFVRAERRGDQRRLKELGPLLSPRDLDTLATEPAYQKSASLAGAMLKKADSDEAREEILRAFLAQPRATDDRALAKLAAGVLSRLESRNSWEFDRDQARAGQAALNQLDGLEQAARLEAELRPSGYDGRAKLARFLLTDPDQGLKELGSRVVDEMKSEDAQPVAAKIVGRLPGQACRFAHQLADQLKSRAAGHELFRAVLSEPDRPVDAQLALEIIEALSARSSWEYRPDIAEIGMTVLGRLPAPYQKAHQLATELQTLATDDKTVPVLTRELLTTPEFDTPEQLARLAVAVVSDLDPRDGSRLGTYFLQRLQEHSAFKEASQWALQVAPKLDFDEARLELFKTVLAEPGRKADATLALDTIEALQKRSSWEFRDDSATVGFDMLDRRLQGDRALVEELRVLADDNQTKMELARKVLAGGATTASGLGARLIPDIPAGDGARLGRLLLQKSQGPGAAFALEIEADLEHDEGRQKLFEAALANPQSAVSAEFGLGVMQAIQARSSWEFRSSSAEVGARVLSHLSSQPRYQAADEFFREFVPLAGETQTQMEMVSLLLADPSVDSPSEVSAFGAALLEKIPAQDGAGLGRSLVRRLAAHPEYAEGCRYALDLDTKLDEDVARQQLFRAVLQNPEKSLDELGLTAMGFIGQESSWEYKLDQSKIGTLTLARLAGTARFSSAAGLAAELQEQTSHQDSLLPMSRLLLSAPEVSTPEEVAAFGEAWVRELDTSEGAELGRWLTERLSRHAPFGDNCRAALELTEKVRGRVAHHEIFKTVLAQPGKAVGARFGLDVIRGIQKRSPWDFLGESSSAGREVLRRLSTEATYQPAWELALRLGADGSEGDQMVIYRQLLADPRVTSPQQRADLGRRIAQEAGGFGGGGVLLEELKNHPPYRRAAELAQVFWNEQNGAHAGLFQAIQESPEKKPIQTAQSMLSSFPAKWKHERRKATLKTLDWLGSNDMTEQLRRDLEAAPKDFDAYAHVMERLTVEVRHLEKAEEVYELADGADPDTTEIAIEEEYVEVGDFLVDRQG